MLKLETLFMLVNAVLYDYGPRFFKKGQSLYQKKFCETLLNFRIKTENFRTLINFKMS